MKTIQLNDAQHELLAELLAEALGNALAEIEDAKRDGYETQQRAYADRIGELANTI